MLLIGPLVKDARRHLMDWKLGTFDGKDGQFGGSTVKSGKAWEKVWLKLGVLKNGVSD